MSDNTFGEAYEKCESSRLEVLIDIAEDATGVFSDHGGERLTVKLGGSKLSYCPRDPFGRVDHRTDPVLNHVSGSDELRITKTSQSRRTGIDGDIIETPMFTIEVVK